MRVSNAAARIHPLQWPNVLSLDASLVALVWMALFATRAPPGAAPGIGACLVLALSVWLTYTADRLFDVSGISRDRLLAHRHRFAKDHRHVLWPFWWIVLVADIGLAATTLDSNQLFRGFLLLAVCLLYTLLNQRLSKYFFPKEICVALIFAAGTQIFLPHPVIDSAILAFALLCLTNCLLIAEKERSVDISLQVRSLSFALPKYALPALLGLSLVVAAASPLASALLPPGLALSLLFSQRKKIPFESYRSLCDASLLLGPTVFWLAGSA